MGSFIDYDNKACRIIILKKKKKEKKKRKWGGGWGKRNDSHCLHTRTKLKYLFLESVHVSVDSFVSLALPKVVVM